MQKNFKQGSNRETKFSDTSNQAKRQASLKELLIAHCQICKERNIPLSELMDNLGSKGFGLLLVFLSLPSALPIPAPGYSSPFGIAIALIALQLLLGRTSLKLPKSLEKIEFKSGITQKILISAIHFLDKIETFIKPRWPQMQNKTVEILIALTLILMATLMILPIPMTNTLPAMIIFLMAVSLSENDGLLTLLSLGLSSIVLAFYLCVLYLIIDRGPEALKTLINYF